jgi:predicted RNA-binding Zn-ribbon protein involved in translation (DUF1610 family)
MNRIDLRLFSPTDEKTEAASDDTFEDIIPFERARRSIVFSARMVPPVARARLIHQNSECPDCGRHNIEPLELADSVISPRNRMPVPGTATIVGFHCNDCGIEWPVYELSRRNG